MKNADNQNKQRIMPYVSDIYLDLNLHFTDVQIDLNSILILHHD